MPASVESSLMSHKSPSVALQSSEDAALIDAETGMSTHRAAGLPPGNSSRWSECTGAGIAG
jgi:hypothetical protein